MSEVDDLAFAFGVVGVEATDLPGDGATPVGLSERALVPHEGRTFLDTDSSGSRC